MFLLERGQKGLPGLLLCATLTIISVALERLQVDAYGTVWIGSLVIAIILGTAVHSLAGSFPVLESGVRFCAKPLLEVAIVLLGASMSFADVSKAGLVLMALVVLAVSLSLCTGYAIGRLFGLPDKLALLVACGNSICGNSAILAAGPVIDAQSEDIASSVAFTAALGVLVVLLLPLAPRLIGLNELQYGIVAGMTVYAVPQVLAVTATTGTISTQIGAIVKLMRVLMLGPVVLFLGFRSHRSAAANISMWQMIPWFIAGFLLMMTLRSLDVLPVPVITTLHETSVMLTILSMAALGLSVNIRSVLAVGGRVLAAGILSLLALGLMSLAVIALLPAPIVP